MSRHTGTLNHVLLTEFQHTEIIQRGAQEEVTLHPGSTPTTDSIQTTIDEDQDITITYVEVS